MLTNLQHRVQFTRSTEEDEDKEASSHPCHSFETIQIH